MREKCILQSTRNFASGLINASRVNAKVLSQTCLTTFIPALQPIISANFLNL